VIRVSFGKSVARSTLIGGLALLAIPAVAGCEAGADAPTLEFHSASSGAHADFNGISISDAFVLGAPSGSAVPAGGSASLFVGLYNTGTSDDTLESVTAQGHAASVTIKGGSVTIPASASANLTGPEPVVVLKNLSQPISGGQDIPVTFDFAHAGAVTLELPIEAQSEYFSTYSPPAPASSATPKASPSPSASASGKAKPTPSPSK
jgi:copper(I)-binding protein